MEKEEDLKKNKHCIVVALSLLEDDENSLLMPPSMRHVHRRLRFAGITFQRIHTSDPQERIAITRFYSVEVVNSQLILHQFTKRAHLKTLTPYGSALISRESLH